MGNLMVVDENGDLQEVTITGFPLWPERIVPKFKRVVVNGETIAGEDIKDVFPPEPGNIVWRIILKNGQLWRATGNVLLVTE
jgi:hypothetical protein